jgi:hypothetical protein
LAYVFRVNGPVAALVAETDLTLLMFGGGVVVVVFVVILGAILVSILQNFFSSSLMTRPNKLKGLPLGTLSSQVLEFEGKARANPIGGPFRCFLLG